MLLTLWCRAGAGLGRATEEMGGISGRGKGKGRPGRWVLLLKTLKRSRVLPPERPRQRGVEVTVTMGLRIGDCVLKTRTQAAGPTT